MKKFISLILACCIVAGILPFAVFATDVAVSSDYENYVVDVTAAYASKQIKIKSVETGNYVCGHNNSKVHSGGTCGSGTFEVTPLTSDGWVGIKLQGKNYISVADGDYLQTTATNYEAWECFKIYEYGGNQYLLSQKNMKFVQATDEDGRPLKAVIGEDSSLSDATWERFQIEILGDSQNSPSKDQYSALTPTIQYLTPAEAEAFIAFMYNKTRSQLTESEKNNNSLYDYLTGQIPRGTYEYELAQMNFLVTSAEAINKHMGESGVMINTSVDNLTVFLMDKMKDESGAAQELVNGCVSDVKSTCRALILDLIGSEGGIGVFETVLNEVKDIIHLKEEVQKFVNELKALFDLANLIAANNNLKAYEYYIVYVNNRKKLDTSSTGHTQFDVYIASVKMSTTEIDIIGGVFDKLGVGHSWTNDDVQHLLNIFAEFTYHSQTEFDSRVSFEKESLTITDNKTYKNPATFNSIYGTDVEMVYSSSNPSIATVSENGTITPLLVGTTYITATASNGKKAVCKVEVLPISGYCGGEGNGKNLIWEFDRVSTLTISGTGAMMAFESKTSAPWYNICRSQINSVVVESGVTTIGDYAFYDCRYLTSVYLPNSITTIGNYAFDWCYHLTSIDIPNSVTAIGNYAFDWCKNLTSIDIPNRVSTIGNYAFNRCENLASVNIGNSVTTIGDYAFSGCDLTSINLPNSVTTIGNYAFSGCDLVSIDIPNSVTTIGNYAFAYCNFSNIDIPDNVNTIGNRAFYSCENLASVNIGNSVTTIGDHSFTDCYNLTSFTVDAENTSYSNDEYGALFNRDKTTLIKYPTGNIRTSYTIPDSVITIGDCAFYLDDFIAVSNLTSVDIPNSVTTIGDRAFSGCNLTSIDIPDSVTTIGRYAFENCDFTSIDIPNSVTTIGDYAFSGCNPISVYIGNSVTNISNYVFYGCNAASFTVDAENLNYSSDEYGVLFDKDKTTLIKYPTGNIRTSYTIPNSVITISNSAFRGCDLISVRIPDSVTTIGIHAFSYCKNLTSANIPNGLTNIAGSTFAHCENLTSVSIPSSVMSFGASMFDYCSQLSNIYYSGTQSQWNAIQKGFNWDSYTGYYTVSYNVPVTGVWLNTNSVTLAAGESYSLIATIDPTYATNNNLLWSSAQSDVVAVSSSGVVTAKSAGTATVTVKTSDGAKTATCTVTVIEPVTVVMLNKASTTLKVGTTETLIATVSPSNATNKAVTWASSNTSVATVSASGVVTAKATGIATITVTTSDGQFTDTCTVTVKESTPSELPEITTVVEKTSMILGNDLSIMFAFTADDIVGENNYAVITKTYADGTASRTEQIEQSAWGEPIVINGKNYYAISFSGVAAKEMTDKVQVQIFNEDGKAISEVFTDSIRDYAMRMIENGTNVQMFVDMLVYGAEAQKQFDNYAGNDFAISQLTAEQLAQATPTVNCKNNLVANNKYRASSLILENNIKLLFLFAGIDPTMTATIAYEDHYGNTQNIIVEGTNFAPVTYQGENCYSITVDKLVVADARQLVSVVVNDADGNEIASASDSVESYIARMSTTGTLYESILKFADSAATILHNYN